MLDGTVIKKYNKILEFNPENCVGCGICEKTCPKSAIAIYRKNDRFEAIISEKCAVCGICADFCFYGAIRHEGSVYREIMEEIGFRKVTIDERLCIICGLCMRECPRGAIKVLRRIDLKKLRRGSLRIDGGCIDCKLCIEVCPTKAIIIKNNKPEI
ncbi:MAG: 4Fe-4S binding protein, partial [Archaeoglobaceae archaeon]|nr:4Fe-4S binding protein [Archaeoglobaceae archaeon]MDW8118874.1 4Fe-4S binding protein [Archaeoglobaceae archaeon]